MNTPRTDVHRPGAIVPAKYDYVFSYDMPSTEGGIPTPGYRVNCVRDRALYESMETPSGGWMLRLITPGEHDQNGLCCLTGLREIARLPFVATGGPGKCSICSAHYVHGDVWRYRETGELLHVGHNCALMKIYVATFRSPHPDPGWVKRLIERTIVVNATSEEEAERIIETYYDVVGRPEFQHKNEETFCVISSVEVSR